VQHALSQAQNGDTVTLPPGTCTYTSTLNLTAAINLIAATQGTTIIDNVDKSNCRDHPAISIDIPSALPWRLSGLTIQGSAPDKGFCSEYIDVKTNSHAFRIDHIKFNNMQSTGIKMDGDEWGVVDHNTFNGSHQRGVQVHHNSWGQIGAWGDNSWAQPDYAGTNQAVYVEDNTFNITNASGAGSVACEKGCRVVVRHNNMPFMGNHGTDSSQRERSMRHFEVYSNNFNDNGSAVGQGFQVRGGTGVFFNNSFTATQAGSYGGLLTAVIYREADNFTPWGPSSVRGGCYGNSPFDNNDGQTYEAGTFDGASGGHDVLSDPTKHWTVNRWVGYGLYNVSSGLGASISGNTETTITTYPSVYGGVQAHKWNSGDTYKIFRASTCLDQPGRGQGDYISGGGNGIAPTPVGWPHQALDPIYEWGNTFDGSPVAAMKGAYYTHIKADRDYYAWTPHFTGASGTGSGPLSSRPTTCTPLVAYWATDKNTLYQCSSPNEWTTFYTPYIYPHPLQGVSASPAPPTGVKVTGIH